MIEAAGNGHHDLDVFQQAISGNRFVLSRTHPDEFKESGAIMVGGSTSTYPYQRWAQSGQGSCFGSRIDCFAWAQRVRTCLVVPFFGDVYDDFGGTSSASAIVAGAALLIEGVAENSPGPRLAPGPMRSVAVALWVVLFPEHPGEMAAFDGVQVEMIRADVIRCPECGESFELVKNVDLKAKWPQQWDGEFFGY